MAVAGFSYGSDDSGLVWGFLIGQDARALPIGVPEALAWMRAPQSGQFVWLHFNLSNTASERWLRQHAGLADEFYATLHQGSRSTRIEIADNALIAVVNDVLHGFSLDSAEISTLWAHVTPHAVISARRKPLASIERLRQAVLQGAPLRSPVELLVHLLQDQADVLVNIVRDAVARVDTIEDRLLAGRLTRKREDLGALRRVLVCCLNSRLFSSSSFSATASLSSRNEKNFISRSAAIIQVSTRRTNASAALLSCGLRTRTGTIAVP